MRKLVKTLLIGAEGFGPDAIRTDSSLHLYLKRLHTGNKRQIFGGYDNSFSGTGLTYTENRYETLSYARDWEDAFVRQHNLNIDQCNATDILSLRRHMQLVADYDLIVILHSAVGDDMNVISKVASRLRKRRGKLVIFFGNEYDLMSEKIAFANNSKADFVCSQLPQPTAEWLYNGVQTAQILEVPHALNPSIYRPDQTVERVIDLGFAGALYHNTIGDLERTLFIKTLSEVGPQHGLVTDIRLMNFSRPMWAQFTRMSKAIIGAESGTYYLQRSGEGVRKALQYQKEYPNASFDEVYKYAFSSVTDYRAGKCISSRHFEPIGTMTCQFLLEGEYNGILKPYENYIPVKKDYSNLDEALRLFKDDTYRKQVASKTFEYVMDCHTYSKRVEMVVNKAIGL
jgi:hypothetical protein